MQVSVESTGNLGRRVTVTVPAERLEQEFANRLKSLSKQIKMPGFRPGKVPLKVVEAKYGSKLIQEISGDLIQSTFTEAIGQEGLKPAGGPKIEPKSLERGKSFEYTAEFEVYPEIPKPELTGCKFERFVCEITGADIDRMIETLRKQRTVWQPVEREARDGDQVIIDFQGKIDGETFPGGESTDFMLELGAGTLIEGFEAGLAGAKGGEERTLALTFPEDYPQNDLAGKAATFDVKVKQVGEPQLPQLNEDFVRQLGIEDGNMETFRREVKANLERELRQRQRSLLHDQVIESVLDLNQLDIPESLLAGELERVKRTRAASQDGQAAEAVRLTDHDQEQARTRVAIGLIFNEVIRVNSLKPDPESVRAHVQQIAAGYEDPDEFVSWFYQDRERVREVESQVLEETAVAALLATAEVTDKPMSFQELTQAAGRLRS